MTVSRSTFDLFNNYDKSIKFGGRLSNFHFNWPKSDIFVYNLVKDGLYLKFNSMPPLVKEPTKCIAYDEKLSVHVDEMLRENVLEEVPLGIGRFWNTIFLVLSPDRVSTKERLILNMKP